MKKRGSEEETEGGRTCNDGDAASPDDKMIDGRTVDGIIDTLAVNVCGEFSEIFNRLFVGIPYGVIADIFDGVFADIFDGVFADVLNGVLAGRFNATLAGKFRATFGRKWEGIRNCPLLVLIAVNR